MYLKSRENNSEFQPEKRANEEPNKEATSHPENLSQMKSIPMLSGSICKWCLLVFVVLIRLVMLALLVGLVLLVSCHL